MKIYLKKIMIMFTMALILTLGTCVSAFATDDVVVGSANLNNTDKNSAIVGNQLTAPEIGWKRYDDTNSNISYIGSGWSEYSASTEYKNGTAYTNTPNGASVKFNFTGTKIRIINPHNPNQNTSEEVYIDGVKVNTHSLSSANLRQALVCNFENLSDGEHCFEYKFVGTGITAFDAVDIDKSGNLKSYNESISLDKSSMNLNVGDSQQLRATTTPSGAQVTWTSDNTGIATVDSTTGKVIAVKEGTCTITATTADGLTATCVVTVIKEVIAPPVDEPTNDGTLFIELVDGNIKSYDVTATEITNFIQWYKDRDNTKSESPFYKFTKGTYKDYVIHDQIDWFEVR